MHLITLFWVMNLIILGMNFAALTSKMPLQGQKHISVKFFLCHTLLEYLRYICKKILVH